MKIQVKVSYPVTFDIEVPSNFAALSFDEQNQVRSDILDRADMLFGVDSLPEIISAKEILSDGSLETDNIEEIVNA